VVLLGAEISSFPTSFGVFVAAVLFKELNFARGIMLPFPPPLLSWAPTSMRVFTGSTLRLANPFSAFLSLFRFFYSLSIVFLFVVLIFIPGKSFPRLMGSSHKICFGNFYHPPLIPPPNTFFSLLTRTWFFTAEERRTCMPEALSSSPLRALSKVKSFLSSPFPLNVSPETHYGCPFAPKCVVPGQENTFYPDLLFMVFPLTDGFFPLSPFHASTLKPSVLICP